MQSQKYLDRTMLSLAFGESALGTKCIDTRPDDTMYANIEQYTLAVERMKNYHGSTARRNTFVLALVLGGLSFLNPQEALEICFGGASATSGCIAEDVSGYKRFKNIENDVWRIVDWPEPKKAEEKEPLLSEQLALVPAPIRA